MAIIKTPPYFESVVNDGEKRLLAFLKENLPDSFTLIPNIELASKNPRNGQVQFYEYDIIVVAPHAVYNIENKDYSGRLEGDDNFWYLNDKRQPNPLKLGRLKTAILATKFKEKELWPWVYNIVTLSHPRQSMGGIYGAAEDLTFLLNDRLIRFLQTPPDSKSRIDEFTDKHSALVAVILGDDTKRKPEAKKEVAGYQIVEILDREKNFTEYLVKAKGVTSSIQKRVKEYALNIAEFSAERLHKYQKKIQNQYLALNKMRANPFVVNTEFQFDDENGYFYEISDFLDENSLEAELNRKTFTLDEKISVLRNLIAALKEAHSAGIFHRDINPENIFYYHGYARLGNFGKSYFTDETRKNYTVMQTITEENSTPYLAHELLDGDVSQASDIYSLTMLAYKLFTGETPIKTPYELDKIGGVLPEDKLPSKINSMVPVWIDDLCRKNITIDPETRMQGLDEFEQFIEQNLKIMANGSGPVQLVPPPAPVHHHSNDFAEGTRISDYLILKTIGSGGFSKVFKVRHRLQSADYALKLFNESVNVNNVTSEYEALKGLAHPNIVKFIWNGELPETGQFYTVMEYIDGEVLSEYDVRSDKKLPHHRIFQVALDILDALCYLQRQSKSIIHRDIKPDNIIWDKEKNRFVLIDFNVSESLEESKDFVGTRPYIAPDLITDNNRINWDSSSDLFALGITLYQLVCKSFPWKNKVPCISQQPISPKDKAPEISDAFSGFLLKAISTSGANRYRNAQEMKVALEEISVDGILKKEKAVGNDFVGSTQDYVSYLNSLFSQSRYGNAGTRSQKEISAYDRETYVHTKLDEKLIPAIRKGTFKLLIITGNAGDGKTAFIQRIEQNADKTPVIFDHGNGATFELNGIRYISNYDGSQDEEDRENSTVLDEFFSPFENLKEFNKAEEGRIIAINEGRLVEFLKTHSDHSHLGDIIEHYFNDPESTQLPEGLMVINLNLRSVVAKDEITESLLRKQIKALTAPKLWQGCSNCSHAQNCFIKFNVDSLSDGSASDEIISRFEWLLRIVSLKRELHITMRDLRSLLSFVITRDFSCADIKEYAEQGKTSGYDYWKYLYFNVMDSNLKDHGSTDRLIKQLRETDIGLVAVPDKDRDLYYGDHSANDFLEFNNRPSVLLEQFNANKIRIPHYEQNDDYRRKMRLLHQLFVRHQYFEGNANFKLRFPYHSLEEFHSCLVQNDHSKLQQNKMAIAKAISLNEGCSNEQLSEKYLALASTITIDPKGKSYRLFTLDQFDLKLPETHSLTEYLEYEADSLRFIHMSDESKGKPIELPISLELYDMLFFIRQGFTPSLNDISGRFIELQIFKNQLNNLTYDRVMVTKDDEEFYEISKSGLKLTLRKLEVI